VPPATGTALVLLVAFVLPGFITVLFQERTFKRTDDPTPLDRLLRVLYYSVWCYLVLSVVALKFGIDRPFVESLYDRHSDDPAELVWRGALAVLGPATAVWFSTLLWHETGASDHLLVRLHLNVRHQQPTAWDFWFGKKFKTHVRVVYSDGHSVWGYYGGASFASYAKDGRDLYLEYIFPEEAGDPPWFGAWRAENRGGWVRVDDAVCIEFYDADHDQASIAAPAIETGPRAEARRTRGTEQDSAEASGTAPSSKPSGEGRLDV
jgi:hypothetical protein